MGILLAIHILVTIFLILIVLIQKNEGGSSLFASSGGTGGMFNARGVSNVITKVTWFLATVFLVNCILMAAIDSSRIASSQSLIEKKAEKTPAVPAKEETAENKTEPVQPAAEHETKTEKKIETSKQKTEENAKTKTNEHEKSKRHVSTKKEEKSNKSQER